MCVPPSRNIEQSSPDKVSAPGYFVVRCTISLSPYLPKPPPPVPPPSPPLVSDQLGLAYREFFESASSADVRFIFEEDSRFDMTRQAIANKHVFWRLCRVSRLASRFRLYIRERRRLESPDSASGWEDDDDSVEWIPEWLAQNGLGNSKGADPGETEERSGGAEARDGLHEDRPLCYITYRAMLYFLSTERIAFTPLASDFAVELLKPDDSCSTGVNDSDDMNIDDAGTSTGADSNADLRSRRAYLLSRIVGNDYPVEPASLHAIYRLADKLDIPDEKERAKAAIVNGFHPNNVLYELVSTFSCQFDEIQEAAVDFAWKNWVRSPQRSLSPFLPGSAPRLVYTLAAEHANPFKLWGAAAHSVP
ncbi:hypothetical protein JCM11641_008302 [Rhodosporidiobolus odoratus]